MNRAAANAAQAAAPSQLFRYRPGGTVSVPAPGQAPWNGESSGSPAGGDVLGLGELQQPVVGALPADAGLLDPAERRGRVRDQAAVEAHHSGFERLGHPQAAAQVAGVDVGDQPELVSLLAQATASASELNRTTGATGPKISVPQIQAFAGTWSITVGA